MRPFPIAKNLVAALLSSLVLSCASQPGAPGEDAQLRVHSKDEAALTTVTIPAEARSAARKAAPEPLRSSLEAGDLEVGGVGSRYAEIWFVDGVAGEMMTVDMTSTDLDCYLVVYYTDFEGNVWNIAEDDDGGADTNARATFEAPFDGQYEVYCTSYGDRITGDYDLEVITLGQQSWMAGGDPNATYALLVGAGDYPVGAESDLDGVPYDLERMQGLLTGDLGVPAGNIVTLPDARASRINVIDGFRQHLAQAGPGGVAIFYYTGHGTQLGDLYAPDEADGIDDAIALTDGLILLDDELGILIDELVAGNVLVVFDSCHSGTGTRGPDLREKALDYSQVRFWLRAPEQFVASTRSAGGVASPDLADHVLLASSREIEPSLDISGVEAMHGPGGLFTFHLIEAIRDLSPEASFEEIMDETRVLMQPILNEVGEVQIPQLGGRRAGESMATFLRL